MEIIATVFWILKYFLLALLLIILYKSYEFVYLPWRVRQKYKGFKNVGIQKTYAPVLGDFWTIHNNLKENKFVFQQFIDMPMSKPDTEFYVSQLGQITVFEITNVQSLDEFEQQVPSKIDRYSHKGDPLGNLGEGSFGLLETDWQWKERKSTAMRTIGVNQISKFIPMIIESVDEWLSVVKKHERLNLTFEMKRITFKVISKILFGSDFDKIEKTNYCDPKTGITSLLSFEECYFKYTDDEFHSFYDPLGSVFPIFRKYNLVNPFKANAINKKSIYNTIIKFLDSSKDDTSVYRQIKASKKYSDEELISDILGLMAGGFHTSSYALGATLYYLKRNPRVMTKLQDELGKHGLKDIDTKDVEKLKEQYENCDYLNNVIKESLRRDPPGVQSFFYQVKEDTEIRGVPFSKGSFLAVNILAIQYNAKEWQKPLEFIPERFDPDSEYFYKPSEEGKKEIRHGKSYIPFTFGHRNCAGQILARLEIKVVLARVLSKINYEIDEELLKLEHARFPMLSNFYLFGEFC